jgi:hypothetical protein
LKKERSKEKWRKNANASGSFFQAYASPRIISAMFSFFASCPLALYFKISSWLRFFPATFPK